MDKTSIGEKFKALDIVTPNIGLALGILAFSTILSQLTCVPELLIQDNNTPSRTSSPFRDYFKLPLILANISACILKCCFAISGAIIFTDSSNIFDGLLFS